LQGAVTDYVSDIALYGIERARRLRVFTHENRDQLLSELPPDSFAFTASGSLVVAGDAAEEKRLRESAELMERDGFPAEALTSAQVNERLGSTGFLSGLLQDSGGMLNPAQLVAQLVARSGAQVKSRSPVLSLGEQVVEGAEFSVEASRILVCAGPWLPDLLPEAVAWVRPVRAQMLALEPEAKPRLDLPIYTHEGYYYLRPDPRGRILVGGARHLHADQEVGFADGTTPGLQADLLAYAQTYFPDLQGIAPVARWAGTMGFSPDGLPVIGPGPRGTLVATGFTGHGMAYGFRAGRLLANLALGRDDDAADLFSPERLRD
jgi:glycine/D-amino acid oxidase-like deaminating enzyme